MFIDSKTFSKDPYEKAEKNLYISIDRQQLNLLTSSNIQYNSHAAANTIYCCPATFTAPCMLIFSMNHSRLIL